MAKRYNILTRCLAAIALLFVYFFSTSAILVGATTSPAKRKVLKPGRTSHSLRNRGCR